MQFGETVHSLALVSIFSPPDHNLLELSSHAAYICHRGGIDTLAVLDVKSITAVVAMIPDFQVTADGDIITPDNRFSLVEASFVRLTTLDRVQGDNDNDDVINSNNDSV